jgi:hypothetical protein
MSGETAERQLQHHLGGARRPAALVLEVFQSAQEATDIQQHAGEFRPACSQRQPHPLSRRDDQVSHLARTVSA